jgi:hypothetical protein
MTSRQTGILYIVYSKSDKTTLIVLTLKTTKPIFSPVKRGGDAPACTICFEDCSFEKPNMMNESLHLFFFCFFREGYLPADSVPVVTLCLHWGEGVCPALCSTYRLIHSSYNIYNPAGLKQAAKVSSHFISVNFFVHSFFYLIAVFVIRTWLWMC